MPLCSVYFWILFYLFARIYMVSVAINLPRIFQLFYDPLSIHDMLSVKFTHQCDHIVEYYSSRRYHEF